MDLCCIEKVSCKLLVIAFLFFISDNNANMQSFSMRNSEVMYESELIKFLLKSYVKEARPIIHPTDRVNVSVTVTFQRIEDLNEKDNIFTSTVLFAQSWKDPRLRWNMSDFGGVRTVKLPLNSLWTPDIVPYNAASSEPSKHLYEDILPVMHDGTVFWIPMLTLSVRCPMDMTKFPYDTQICHIDFGSWSHSATQMSVSFMESGNKSDTDILTDTSSFHRTEHPQWLLVGNKARASIKNVHYNCCSDPFTVLSVTCKLKRRQSFYRYLAIGPSALLGLLVPVLFLLPSCSHEKTAYGLFILLCLMILVVVLQEAIPFSHGSVPRIGVFYLATMVLTSFSIILSVFVSNLSVRGSRHRPLPAWIQSMFLGHYGLRRLLCVDRYSPVDNVFSASLRGLEEVEQVSRAHHSQESRLESQLSETNKYLHYVVGKMSADVTYDNVSQQWAEFARILDRILFVIFFLLYTMTALTLLT